MVSLSRKSGILCHPHHSARTVSSVVHPVTLPKLQHGLPVPVQYDRGDGLVWRAPGVGPRLSVDGDGRGQEGSSGVEVTPAVATAVVPATAMALPDSPDTGTKTDALPADAPPHVMLTIKSYSIPSTMNLLYSQNKPASLRLDTAGPNHG